MKGRKFAAACTALVMFLGVGMRTPVQAASIAPGSQSVLIRKPKVKRRGTRSLTGRNQKLYKILKKDVANVASGKNPTPIFKISLKSIGLDRFATKKQLGVKSFVDKNGYVTPQVDEALDRYLKMDFTAVINYMYATEPFNLFWFDYYDENAKLDTSPQYNLQFYIHNNRIRYYTESGYIRLKFAVAKNYGSQYHVSAKTYQRAANVTANAKAIVRANAKVSDYNKLMNYAQVICDAVDYDDDAAAKTRKNYTDPWQCLAVFDGNPKTNVVCEGYAKAFAYLCSLTHFNSSAIKCSLMTGTNWIVTSHPDISLHMWDMVHMPDGKNYIVDVTNSDLLGTDDDALVLVGETGTNEDGDIFHQVNDYDFGGEDPHPTVGYNYDSITKAVFKANELSVAKSDYPRETRKTVDEHIFDQGKVTKAATLTHAGTLTQTCQFDGEQRKVKIPKLKIGKPRISRITYNKGQATLTWGKAKHARKYQLAYRLKGRQWRYVNASSTHKSVRHLKKKKTYHFKVKAYNGKVSSSWSDVKKLKTA